MIPVWLFVTLLYVGALLLFCRDASKQSGYGAGADSFVGMIVATLLYALYWVAHLALGW